MRQGWLGKKTLIAAATVRTQSEGSTARLTALLKRGTLEANSNGSTIEL